MTCPATITCCFGNTTRNISLVIPFIHQGPPQTHNGLGRVSFLERGTCQALDTCPGALRGLSPAWTRSPVSPFPALAATVDCACAIQACAPRVRPAYRTTLW